MSEKWNDKLRRKMENYTQAPPEGLWEAVEAGLPVRTAGFPWMWALAGVAAVVLAVVLLWRPAEPSVKYAPAEAVSQLVPPSEEILPLASLDQNDKGTTHLAQKDEETATIVLDDTDSVLSAPSVIQSDSEESYASEDSLPLAPLGQNDKEAAPLGQTDEETAPVNQKDNTRPERIDIVRQKTGGPVITASLIAGGIPGSAATTFDTYGMSTVANKGPASVRMAPVALLSRNRPTTNEVRHSVAMRVGALFNLSFNEHWGVETGLQLSNLQTQTKSVTGDMTLVSDKTISYLGIPLLAVYTPVRMGKFAIYTSAGPMFEYGFRSFGKEETYIGKERITQDKIGGREQDAIWSLGLNLGAQWLIWDLGGLFIQPGLSWHVAGQGHNETFYTAHPVSFAISTGFRFTF